MSFRIEAELQDRVDGNWLHGEVDIPQHDMSLRRIKWVVDRLHERLVSEVRRRASDRGEDVEIDWNEPHDFDKRDEL